MKFWKEFKNFAARGNLFDLAVGVMIGAAFNGLVQSLVKDIMTPIIGLFMGKMSMSEWVLRYEIEGLDEVLLIRYGAFLQQVFDFLILAFVVFVIVHFIAKLKKKAEDVNNTETPTPKDILLLTEIRDLLKNK